MSRATKARPVDLSIHRAFRFLSAPARAVAESDEEIGERRAHLAGAVRRQHLTGTDRLVQLPVPASPAPRRAEGPSTRTSD